MGIVHDMTYDMVHRYNYHYTTATPTTWGKSEVDVATSTVTIKHLLINP